MKRGRRSRIDRDFAKFQRFLIAEWFGRADEVDGEGNAIKPGIKATQADPDFRSRYKMGRHLFLKIYEDIIDPMRGSQYFRKGKNRAGIGGPTTLLKLLDFKFNLNCLSCGLGGSIGVTSRIESESQSVR